METKIPEGLTPVLIAEIKQYVFALYIGQKVTTITGSNSWRLVIDKSGNYDTHRDIGVNEAIAWKAVLLLRPLSSITDSEAIEVAKIICGEQYTDIELSCEHTYHARVIQFDVTIKPEYNFLTISFITHKGNQHTDTNRHSVSISNWGSINWYRHYLTANTELSNCVRSQQVWEHLRQQGFALPVFYKGTLYSVAELEAMGIFKLQA